MKPCKPLSLVLTIGLGLLAAGCQPQTPTVAPTLLPPNVIVETAPAATAAAVAAKGVITGVVHLMAPPTPSMVVYALDPATSVWASTETQPTDGEAAYRLEVPPGTYQVFAAVASDTAVALGYGDATGTKLGLVSVAAGQTVANIPVRPPSQNECGSMLGFPASPDGRFAAAAGPVAGCAATQAAGGAVSMTDAGRIQFQPNTTRWQTPGNLGPGAVIRFVLGAQKGQQMTVRLTTEPASDQPTYATLYISSADGKVSMASPTLYWSQVLEASQDYTIEVRSLAKDNILYTLSVDIPATIINPANGDKYDLPDLSVCKTIQEMAAQALGVDFTLEARAPFLDAVGGEAGQGCRLSGGGNGKQFTSPQDVVAKLVSQMGFDELPNYRADGPTGAAAGAVRDMALMLISASWKPDMGVPCPADKPIAECNLTPEQKIYLVEVDLAYYRTDFTLKGSWQDAKTGLSLDLDQVWKNVYGHHLMVAQGGGKIDTLDTNTITGTLQAKVATVQFQSAFAPDLGTAQITYVDANTITWKITAPPKGEYYLPAEATLTRK